MEFDNREEPAMMDAERDWLERKPNLIETIEDI